MEQIGQVPVERLEDATQMATAAVSTAGESAQAGEQTVRPKRKRSTTGVPGKFSHHFLFFFFSCKKNDFGEINEVQCGL